MSELTKKAKVNLNTMAHFETDAAQRLRSILIANEVATWTWDIDKDLVVADENLARLFGVSPEDAAGGPIDAYLQAIYPDDRAHVAGAIKSAIEGPNGRYEIDYRIVRTDGTVRWVRARGIVERDSDGKPERFPGVVTDITERKVLEQSAEELGKRLEQQTQLFDVTLSSITDFVYIFNPEGRFIYVNRALLDLWNLGLKDAVGKNFHELKYPDELADRLQKQIQQVFQTRVGLIGETPYTSPAGVGGYYEYIFRPVFDSEGRVEFVAGSTRDITQRKLTEEELRQSEERYRRIADTLENQVAERTSQLEDRNNDVLNQSRQLRDLTVRLMETQDQERRHIARELHDSAGQTIAVLLFNLEKLLTELKKSDSPLQKLAGDTLNDAQMLNQEIRTTSYLLHPPLLDEIGLQPALEWYVNGLKDRVGLDVNLEIGADFERPSRQIDLAIFRVVQECLTNIHRHSGSKTAKIGIARNDADVVITVSDAGRGMSVERLLRVQTEGGVGLRGIRERVRQLGGEVRLESEEGKGTTVTVSLPSHVSD